MRKLITTLVFIAIFVAAASAQKFAFVDTKYILNNIPSYKAAMEEIEKTSSRYQSEIEKMYDELEKLYKNYQAEKVLLSSDMQKQKEDDIIARERKIKGLQKKYFGQNGELFKKQQELIKPIQDQVFEAVSDIAKDENYSFIYDIASGVQMLYTNPKLDKSDDVLMKLGYK
ncbi:MAG: OmpH family outer membrane protein [Bacteroidales bacterium]|jgi:outer membrane protein|nr:OmpH family outer membrane protein [Bacteroidales bacterium]